MANLHPVFVYGTLMQGQRANHFLRGCDFGGCFRLEDYAMYHLGSYPGIKPCQGESVQGELYYVTDAVLAQMDEYEDEGSLYLRKTVLIHGEETTVSAQVYVYNRDVGGCRLLRCRWNSEEETK